MHLVVVKRINKNRPHQDGLIKIFFARWARHESPKNSTRESTVSLSILAEVAMVEDLEDITPALIDLKNVHLENSHYASPEAIARISTLNQCRPNLAGAIFFLFWIIHLLPASLEFAFVSFPECL